MDVFKFTNPIHELHMTCGETINGLLAIEWIEKYQELSEFKLTAPMWIDPLNTIPIGSFISTIDSDIVMVVENHELEQKKGELPKLVISGRELHGVAMERRAVGAFDHWNDFPLPGQGELMHQHYHSTFKFGDPEDPETGGYRAWEAINSLILQLVTGGWDSNDDWEDEPPRYFTHTDVWQGFPDDWDDVPHNRYLETGEEDFWRYVADWLKLDNFGMQTVRPYRYGSSELNPTHRYQTCMYVNPGRDKTRDVIFSHDTGEILSSNYLWSDKDYYTHIFIRTTHMAYIYKMSGAPTGWNRRYLYHDYSEVDSQWDLQNGNTYVLPQEDLDAGLTPAKARNRVLASCKARTEELLNKHRNTQKSTLEVDRHITTYNYREDFLVGDIITVNPGFIEPETRRIIEYVEIEDERGYVGYPVLDESNDKVWGHD